jgi:hypothetical protein
MDKPYRLLLVSLSVVSAFAALLIHPLWAQDCKATDGSCGLQLNMPKMDWSTINLPQVQSMGEDLATTPDQPATIGVITFRGNGTVCVGLLRRAGCNK